jgi:hypothetical protein
MPGRRAELGCGHIAVFLTTDADKRMARDVCGISIGQMLST